MFTSIVVGTDGSASATAAVVQAAQLAKACGAVVHVVTAYRPLESYVSAPEAIAAANVQHIVDPAATATKVLEEAAAKVAAEGVECRTHSCSGDPANALIEVAETEHGDLIVVGNKGMNSKARFLLGSVRNKVSHHAPCAVLIAKTA